ncbi:Pycsar system effector family protein [Novosphingobium colocasiae]|uniref:Pycsar effector protein domain-containing protein n=1 Tax=Novosphingobium colocasiae TaxID=1256513 RepID=A0A918UHZ2_9SPHN|nr:Pycsar system effector family protein [Novosphingobium colocasiae]GGZ10794.1 hypothetical protein GCM10011614_27210 [Novosphingobium colocasiae]
MGEDGQAGSGAIDPARFDAGTYSVHAIHMVRTCQTNHMALSQMADNKANILMGMTFLLFSLSLSEVGRGDVRTSLVVLLVTSFVSSLLAMVAVMPKITSPHRPDEPEANLLFFGVFTGLDQEEFVDRLMARSQTDGQVLSTMLRDIHQNGSVLQHRKYRYLAYAFRTLRLGLILAFAVFLIESRVTLLGWLGGV